MKKLLLLLALMFTLSGCLIHLDEHYHKEDVGGLILNDSEVVYVIENGSLNYYNEAGELVKSVNLDEVEGWYVLSPGYLSKLIKEKIDENSPAEPE